MLVSSPPVIVGGISVALCRATGPVSRPSSIRMRETPVSVSPCMMARSMGAAPRYFGRREACTFREPCLAA